MTNWRFNLNILATVICENTRAKCVIYSFCENQKTALVFWFVSKLIQNTDKLLQKFAGEKESSVSDVVRCHAKKQTLCQTLYSHCIQE